MLQKINSVFEPFKNAVTALFLMVFGRIDIESVHNICLVLLQDLATIGSIVVSIIAVIKYCKSKKQKKNGADKS